MVYYYGEILSTPLISKGLYEYRLQKNLQIPLCEIGKLKLMMVLVGFSSILKNEKHKVDTRVKKEDVIPITFINNSNVNETKFLN
jgi:hypothetical protein